MYSKPWFDLQGSRCTLSHGLIYRGQDVSAFYPKPDVILLADVVYYEEVSTRNRDT